MCRVQTYALLVYPFIYITTLKSHERRKMVIVVPRAAIITIFN